MTSPQPEAARRAGRPALRGLDRRVEKIGPPWSADALPGEAGFPEEEQAAKAARPRFDFLSGFEGTYIFGSGQDVLDTTEHATRFEADLAQLAEDGLTSFRACIPWHHIEKSKGCYDWSWTDRYLACARDADLDPIADLLHHTSFPDWLERGFADPLFVPRYLAFVKAFARRYPFVRRYTIINEPYVTAWFCGNCGIWHPHAEGAQSFVPMLYAVVRALCQATEALSGIVPDVRFVHTESCEFHSALDPEAQVQARFGNAMRFCVLDLMLGRVGRGHALYDYLTGNGLSDRDLAWLAEHPARLDVLGLDYYSHSELCWTREGRAARHPVRGFADVVMDYARRYRRPVMLGETNLCGTVDDRVNWLKYMVGECETLQSRLRGIGLSFEGFCWYPYIDSTDWNSLVREASRHIDPQGIIQLSPDFGRLRSRLSETYASLAKGRLSAADILPGPFHQAALEGRGVRNYLPHMRWYEAPAGCEPSPDETSTPP